MHAREDISILQPNNVRTHSVAVEAGRYIPQPRGREVYRLPSQPKTMQCSYICWKASNCFPHLFL